MSDPVPVHAYAGKHRGTPRRCAACGTPETDSTVLHAFYDEPPPAAPAITRTQLSGRHKANTPTLEGP